MTPKQQHDAQYSAQCNSVLWRALVALIDLAEDPAVSPKVRLKAARFAFNVAWQPSSTWDAKEGKAKVWVDPDTGEVD